jgi:glycosyltransferase involved in cell wall biosynthesis
MEKKRILYCEGNLDGTVGGSFFSLLFLLQGLDRDRFEPVAVFHREHALLPRYFDSKIDTRVIPYPAPVQLPSTLLRPVQQGVNLYRQLPKFARDLSLLLRNEGIDLVHLNNSITRNHAWMMGARLAGVPCITHERGINPSYSAMSRWLGRGLKAVICISDAVRQNFVDRGVTGLRLTKIYNGLDPSQLVVHRSPESIRSIFGIGRERRLVLMLGNIKEWKGQESVVRAMAAVRNAIPDALCLFVGDTAASDQYYRDRLNKLVKELKLGEHVLFTGYQSHVGDFINASDVVVHASVNPEPFGRVLIEAMALRKPVVGANAGAVPEIIRDEETGILFPPNDAEQLGAAIIRLLSHPHEARSMGDAGRARLESTFHIDNNTRETMALYQRLL